MLAEQRTEVILAELAEKRAAPASRSQALRIKSVVSLRN